MRDLLSIVPRLLRRLGRDRLTDAQIDLLRALLEGWTLKSQRTLDGQKAYRLHALAGEVVEVAGVTVDGLVAARLIQSNQKFPAATYLLTDRGRVFASRLTSTTAEPLTASRFPNP